VAVWMAEVQAEWPLAEARLRDAGERRRMTDEEIARMVPALGSLVMVLADANPADKAEVYRQLGLTLIYHPDGKRLPTPHAIHHSAAHHPQPAHPDSLERPAGRQRPPRRRRPAAKEPAQAPQDTHRPRSRAAITPTARPAAPGT